MEAYHESVKICLAVREGADGTWVGQAELSAPAASKLSVSGFATRAEAEKELLEMSRLEIDLNLHPLSIEAFGKS